MGGVAPRIHTWAREYKVEIDGWQSILQASVDYAQRRLILFSEFYCQRNLTSKHPFRSLLGVKFGHLDAQDLWYVLAEIERPLKPAWKLFWIIPMGKAYAIRVIFPSDGDGKKQIGIVIANTEEQKKLSRIFRDALAAVESLD